MILNTKCCFAESRFAKCCFFIGMLSDVMLSVVGPVHLALTIHCFKLHVSNRRACIRHQSMKTAVLSFHGCLINTGVEKINNIEL
jgi:hypothetical protein